MQRWGFSLIDKKCRIDGSLNWDEFEIFWDICIGHCPRHFGMKPLSYGSETLHSERIYFANVHRRGFSLFDQKMLLLKRYLRYYGIFVQCRKITRILQEVFSLICYTFIFAIKFKPYNLQVSFFNKWLLWDPCL